jgi:mannosyltransferase OCH1-like enzyme
MIKLLHRIWIGNPPMKRDYSEYVKTFESVFDDFTTIHWNDINTREFVKTYYPKWESYIFNEDNNPAFRANIARFLILKHFGGLYSDWDIKILDPEIKKIMINSDFSVTTEIITDESFAAKTAKIPIRQNIPEDIRRIADYFIYCEPNHVIWDDIFKCVEERLNRTSVIVEDYDVLYTVGPDVITTIVNLYENKYKLNVLSLTDSKKIIHECHGSSTWKQMLKQNSVGWYE